MTSKLNRDATTLLVRSCAYLDCIWQPVRFAFQSGQAPAIFAARQAGLQGMAGSNGHAPRHWKRNQRSREALVKAGFMSAGELTPEGKRLARSWTWGYGTDILVELLIRLTTCIDRGWCRDGFWVPEPFLCGAKWGTGNAPFVGVQICLTPCLVDQWAESACTIRGHCFYRIHPGVDNICARIADSIPAELDPRPDLIDLYDTEFRRVQTQLQNMRVYHADIGEIPLILSEPMRDETKDYNDTSAFPPLFVKG